MNHVISSNEIKFNDYSEKIIVIVKIYGMPNEFEKYKIDYSYTRNNWVTPEHVSITKRPSTRAR